MESFFLAETTKYLYLLFAGDDHPLHTYHHPRKAPHLQSARDRDEGAAVGSSGN
eukprot:COSAG06_NODE_49736_length_323_cov_0.910714_2_plen_53_part_01